MFQTTVIVADLVVLVAVAVNSVVVLPKVVGVPVTMFPEIVNPVGKVFALYVMALPAALMAVNVVVLELFCPRLMVAPLAGVLQVTVSGLTVIV
jgi:hypothetical protein